VTDGATWFTRRTFRAADYDPDRLASRKAELGITVSVVLPALNEADTVGDVVASCVSLRGVLVDEVVVIDGNSSDGTAGIATEAGARVHQHTDILPEYGAALGKGDALWRSLTVTSGDIVVFCDTDIRNPDPRFVWGLLGPLLHVDEVQFVKAFYERPVEMAGVLHATGGGRVTELTARPLLNLFWPQLAGLVQPLSGEYAGRRSLLEGLPFFTGYGVEIGHLIDTLDLHGAEAIAQVDLAERIHRNQHMSSLSRMAYGIMQVAGRRLAAEGRLHHFDDSVARSYLQFERDEDGGVSPREAAVPVTERPAIATLRR
jgi:glucosyl-3-phosphoglycerate synthase